MKTSFFSQRHIVLAVLITLAFSVSSPYFYHIKSWMASVGCACCTVKHKGCERCAKLGHRVQKIKMACHEEDKDHGKEITTTKTNKKRAQLSALPCSTPKKSSLRPLTQDPYLPNSMLTPHVYLLNSLGHSFVLPKFIRLNFAPETPPPIFYRAA